MVTLNGLLFAMKRTHRARKSGIQFVCFLNRRERQDKIYPC